MVRGAGIHGDWRYVRRDADACLGYDSRIARYVCMAAWAARDPLWRRCAALYLADVGILPESRFLPVHQRIHDAVWIQRWQRQWICEPAAVSADGEAAAGGRAA